MTRPVGFVFHTFIFLVLTLLTQIGGIAYLGALLLARSWRRRAALTIAAATLTLYVALTFFLVPPLARQLGRVRVPCDSTTLVACVLSRAYLRPGTLNLVRSLEQHMADRYPGSSVTVLEGSFPFFDGFPLPPHLSHHDGRKVDLAFLYRDAATGASIARGSPSPIGYFHYQQPRARPAALRRENFPAALGFCLAAAGKPGLAARRRAHPCDGPMAEGATECGADFH